MNRHRGVQVSARGLARMALVVPVVTVSVAVAGPGPLFESVSPSGRWRAERRLVGEAWRGQVVGLAGGNVVDLGVDVYPVRWSAVGDTLRAVRMRDVGDEVVDARLVDVVVGRGAVVERVGSTTTAALEEWRGAYVPRDLGDDDVEGRRGLPLQLNAAPIRVAVDPGHGGLGAGVWNSNNGDGAGSHGPSGLTEQWVNLRVAGCLMADLEDDPRFAGSFLVRTSGTQQVSLADRVALAAQGGAAFYLSIHHNGLPTGVPNRTETYYCRRNAACEDACDDMAWSLHDRLVGAFGYTGRGALEDSSGSGRFHFYVLRHAAMPAVLTEASNLNDTAEEALFGNDPLERHARDEAIALHLGLVELAFGTTGVPERTALPAPPDVVLGAPRRGADGRWEWILSSNRPGRHDLAVVDAAGRRRAALPPHEGPGRVVVRYRPAGSAPGWLVVRAGGTIVAVRRIPY